MSAEEHPHLHRLRMLNRISRVITSTTDLDELLRRTAEDIREQFGYFIVAIGLWDERLEHAELRAASSAEPIDLPIGHRQKIGIGVVGEVAKSGESVLVADVRGRHNYVPTHPAVRCEMVCPLKAGGEMLGFLDVEGTEPNCFQREDLLLLETLADHISQAVANAKHLERLAELRQDMANMLVHDLRNPLTVIRSTLELLELTAANPLDAKDRDDQVQDVRAARAACDETLVLIDGFLQLQKLESEALQLDVAEVTPAALLQRVHHQLRPIAEARLLELRILPASELPAILADESLIFRVLQNLALNALKLTPEGGSVSIRVEAAAPELLERELPGCPRALLFEVRDTGPGIAPDHQRVIFDKYGTVQARKTLRAPATGLGLAFCKKAVRAHGGRIWVDSALGLGSTFRFVLPFEPVAEPPPSECPA